MFVMGDRGKHVVWLQGSRHRGRDFTVSKANTDRERQVSSRFPFPGSLVPVPGGSPSSSIV